MRSSFHAPNATHDASIICPLTFPVVAVFATCPIPHLSRLSRLPHDIVINHRYVLDEVYTPLAYGQQGLTRQQVEDHILDNARASNASVMCTVAGPGLEHYEQQHEQSPRGGADDNNNNHNNNINNHDGGATPLLFDMAVAPFRAFLSWMGRLFGGKTFDRHALTECRRPWRFKRGDILTVVAFNKAGDDRRWLSQPEIVSGVREEKGRERERERERTCDAMIAWRYRQRQTQAGRRNV